MVDKTTLINKDETQKEGVRRHFLHKKVPIYDFAIVGSGAAGGVLAYQLTAAGANVVLLESGKQIPSQQLPYNEFRMMTELFWNGGGELTTDGSIAVIRGKAVGGGTLVNQCLLDRFSPEVLQNWQTKSKTSLFDHDTFSKYYDWVESQLSLHTFTRSECNQNAEMAIKGMEQCNIPWEFLRRGQKQCQYRSGKDCIACLGGCPAESKQGTAATFLPKALQQKLTLISDFTVKQVVHGKDHVTLYGKRSALNQPTATAQTFQARKAIICAGAIGSTELLLRSGFKKSLPALGKGFYCHPQTMIYGLFKEPVDAHKGAFQTIRSNPYESQRAGYKLESVFAGPMSISMMLPQQGVEHHSFMRHYRRMGTMEVALRDQSAGEISLNRKGHLCIKKSLNADEKRCAKKATEEIHQILSAAGAHQIVDSYTFFALHPMGGCAIGDSAKHSVVNEQFQLHHQPNLYVVDGSTFPEAPGINPSLTIMSLAANAAQQLLKTG